MIYGWHQKEESQWVNVERVKERPRRGEKHEIREEKRNWETEKNQNVKYELLVGGGKQKQVDLSKTGHGETRMGRQREAVLPNG